MTTSLRNLTQSEVDGYHRSMDELVEEQRGNNVDLKRKAGSCALLFVDEEAKNKILVAENIRLTGVVISKNRTITEAALATYEALKRKSPPFSVFNGAVCWKTFGALDMCKMEDLRLKPLPSNDWVSGTSWNAGFWLSKPPVPDPADPVLDCPPFVASHTWKKTVDQHSKATYLLRTRDETKVFLRSMPTSYTGPTLYDTTTYSADFYWYLRNNYPSKKADALLGYLLEKYKEYEQHAGTLGSSGYGVIIKPWNEAADQEMTLIEMINKLASLGPQYNLGSKKSAI